MRWPRPPYGAWLGAPAPRADGALFRTPRGDDGRNRPPLTVAGAQDAFAPSGEDDMSFIEGLRACDLEQQMSGVRHDGDDAAVPFGGASRNEPATVCSVVEAFDRMQEHSVDHTGVNPGP